MRLLAKSATNTLSALSTAAPAGQFKPLNGKVICGPVGLSLRQFRHKVSNDVGDEHVADAVNGESGEFHATGELQSGQEERKATLLMPAKLAKNRVMAFISSLLSLVTLL
jgi:hypothetical protein